MLDSLKSMKQISKNYLKIPKRVQEILPFELIYEDGIMQIGNLYSKTFAFQDINYAVASNEEKEKIFVSYSDLLNSIDSSAFTQITINNENINISDFEEEVLLSNKNDQLNMFREEYNKMLKSKTIESNNLQQEKYITLSAEKKSYEEAKVYFQRLHSTMSEYLEEMGSSLLPFNAEKRLRIVHDFFRPDDLEFYQMDLKKFAARGHNIKDYLLPANMKVKADHIEYDGKYLRVLFIKDFANYIKDSFISELSELPFNLHLTISMFLIPTHEAVKEVEKRLLGIEANIHKFLQKQAKQDNYTGSIPYNMKMQREEAQEFLNDLTSRDQRMIVATITLVHTSSSLEELNEQTEAIEMTSRKNMCQMNTLRWEQIQGLQTTLPFGIHNIHATRTLTTESVAVLMPFQTQNIFHKNGLYYGQNIVSKKPIIANRAELQNGNSFILGVPGSGKSFFAKREIVNTILATDYDVLIVDPEREYGKLITALGGENLIVSARSNTHINPLDLELDPEVLNPLSDKSEFIMSLFEQLMVEYGLGPTEKTIIDRCIRIIYKDYIKKNGSINPPTLVDLYRTLMDQREPEAENLALAIELFVTGSLNNFAFATNIDTNNRLICYDILDLGSQLKSIGMLVVLDNILNRITKNRENKRNTLIVIDEIYLLFMQEYASNFLYTLWKRIRKYHGYAVGITQNVDDLLQSSTARSMLSNSEFLILLNQAATDRIQLGKLLNISDVQMGYVNNAPTGEGLIKIRNAIIPFADKFPNDTQLYKLMTTKPGEV
ncbi:MAG: VirB4-like conjugal transfer ATPase, CD1110 family [Saccharofermentanales bacterium]|jgi:type IV secretory pathway VirB4 component